LAEERRQWQAVDNTLRGIWQMSGFAAPNGFGIPSLIPQGVL
jgi:hypothetical protein